MTNRRKFLTASFAGLCGGRARAHSPGNALRVAMIGTGNRGGYLLKGVLTFPDTKVVALCDLNPDRLDQAATLAARDKPATYREYRRILERKDVDAVYIATPCDLHVEMVLAALQAGKHVYCEKPAGITPESIRTLIPAVRAAKTVYCIGQQRRSEARLSQTIERIHGGLAGEVVMVKAQRHGPTDLSNNLSSKDWFFFAKRSGDVITEMACHNLDVCNWVTGSRPDRASGFGGTLIWKDIPPGRTNMDGYTLSYDYANGVKASFTQVFFHPAKMPGGGQYYYVYGTRGAVDLIESKFYPLGGGQPVTIAPQVQENEWAHMAHFQDCVRNGKKPNAGISVAATAALTSILGREAIYRRGVMAWQELGVEVPEERAG